jgi:hypothetical protein
MNEIGPNVMLLVIGWVLGLLSGPITEEIRDRREAVRFKNALVVELDELQRRLAYDAFSMADYLGAFDQGLVRWLLASYRDYRGLHVDAETVKVLEEFATYDDLRLEHMNASHAHGTGRVLFPNRMSAPLLEATTPMLPRLDGQLQQKLLEIRRLLVRLDDTGQTIREQYQLGFTEGGARQKDRLNANIGNLGGIWLKAARSTADLAQSIVLGASPVATVHGTPAAIM